MKLFTAVTLSWCLCPFLSLRLVSVVARWQEAKFQLVQSGCSETNVYFKVTHNSTQGRIVLWEFLNKTVSFSFFGGDFLKLISFLSKVWFLCAGSSERDLQCLVAMVFSLTMVHCFHCCLMGLYDRLPSACQPVSTSLMWSFRWTCLFSQWNAWCWNIISSAFVGRRYSEP